MVAVVDDESVGIEVAWIGSVCVLSLARPRKRNALRPIEWEELARLLAQLSQNPSARAIVLTGQGGCFSAGFDLRSSPGPGGNPTLPIVHRALFELYKIPKPTIAAVEGPCIGAGWALALACDLLIGGEGAYFEPPFASRGLVPDAGIAWFLLDRLGRYELTRLSWLDGRYDATEARAHGLLNRVVPAGKALDAALEWGAKLAERPPTTLAMSKSVLRQSQTPWLATALDGEASAVTLNSASPDAITARSNFMLNLGRSPVVTPASSEGSSLRSDRDRTP
jgi:2-(1,2-epoxy-1,2-dihydrophenyl)acetyl-CoA isomerase